MRKKTTVQPGYEIVVTTFRKNGTRNGHRLSTKSGTTGKRATVHYIDANNVPHNRRIVEGATFRDMYKKLVRAVQLPPGIHVHTSGRTFVPYER